jgi:putative addiction module component (TIGR02574 family)
MSSDFSEVLELPPAQRLRLLEAIWDSLSDTLDDVPVPDWQKEELDRREAAFLRAPDTGAPWEEAKAKILARRG